MAGVDKVIESEVKSCKQRQSVKQALPTVYTSTSMGVTTDAMGV